MITESVSIKGDLDVVLVDESGQVRDHRSVKNLVVAVGKSFIASRMTSNSGIVMNHMAIGVANIVPTTSQTLLLGEVGRRALDSTGLVSNVITYTATFPAGTGTGTIAEAGVFNSPSANSGIMLCRTRFNEVNKGASDTVVITWNITVE